jgi:hypothetical protein
MALWTPQDEVIDPLHRLGRNIHRPDDFEQRKAAGSTPRTVTYTRHCAPFTQGNLGSCFSFDTEILTRYGWIPFQDLTLVNEVATVDPQTGTLIFERPTRVIEMPFEGEIFHGEHQALDFMVTPDHMMVVRPFDNQTHRLSSTYEFVPMKDVGWYAGLLSSVSVNRTTPATYTLPGVNNLKRKGQRTDREVPMRAWMHFLGIYLAEGTMIGTPHDQYRIQLAAVKEREKSFIRRTLANMGLSATETPDRFTFSNQQVYEHLAELGLKGVKAPQKFVPRFVFDLSAEAMQWVLEGHREGDGSCQDGRWTHHTSSVQLATDLQRLALMSGKWSTLSARPLRTSTMKDGRIVIGRYPEMTVSVWTSNRLSIDRKKHVTRESYSGMVYCAEVPTYHTLVTRRNGKILIAGNCTGNASAGTLMTDPFWVTGRSLGEAQAVTIYSQATHYNGTPNAVYPPDDCGSSGPAAADALEKDGFITSFGHTTTLTGALSAMAVVPCIFGVSWMTSFDTPLSTGECALTPGATVRGGHEIECFGTDLTNKRFWFYQSWGTTWGGLGNGTFWISFTTMKTLFGEGADCTAFVPNPQAPVNFPVPSADGHHVPWWKRILGF